MFIRFTLYAALPLACTFSPSFALETALRGSSLSKFILATAAGYCMYFAQQSWLWECIKKITPNGTWRELLTEHYSLVEWILISSWAIAHLFARVWFDSIDCEAFATHTR